MFFGGTSIRNSITVLGLVYQLKDSHAIRYTKREILDNKYSKYGLMVKFGLNIFDDVYVYLKLVTSFE